MKKAGKRQGSVIDSRLAFYWIPESFKVFLDLPLEISKERILKNLQTNKLRAESEGTADVEKIYKKITERLQSERTRYKKLYGILNHTDKKNYDLVVDTNKNNLQEVAEIIVKKYRNWLNN